MNTLSKKAWVNHLAAPFDAPLPIWRRPQDDDRLLARVWGAPLAKSALRYAADATTSFGLRCVVTVPTAAWATSRWAYNRPSGAVAWLVIAPWCGILGGAALMGMGLGLDALRLSLMLGFALGNVVYALGQCAYDAVHNVWAGFGRSPNGHGLKGQTAPRAASAALGRTA